MEQIMFHGARLVAFCWLFLLCGSGGGCFWGGGRGGGGGGGGGGDSQFRIGS